MELLSLYSICTSILLSVALLLFLSRWSNPIKKKSVPKSYPLIGLLPEFIKNRHRFLEWVTEALGESPSQTMVFRSPGRTSGIITANPQNVEYVLKTHFDNFPQGELNHVPMEDFLGHGIFNSDGEHWKRQRKTASFEFNKKSLRNFVVDNVNFEVTRRLLPLLKRAEESHRVLDMQDVLQRFAFDNICEVVLGVDPAALEEKAADRNIPENFMRDFDAAAKHSVDRFFNALDITWRVKKFLNIGSEKWLKDSIRVVHDFATKIVRAKKEGFAPQSDDLLSRFASSGEESEDFLRDIVVNFLLAGRETTSSSLSWLFWLLSSRPEVVKKILEEIRSVRAKSRNEGETFTFEELREMQYLQAAISEALRLYPPVSLDTQSCRDGDVLPDGTSVGKGWFVTYSAYAMGRMEVIWGEDCNEYKPERWLVDGEFQPESPFKYPVFHAGPRMCLGKEMAYIQMKSIAACVLERFKIELANEAPPPQYLISLTLRVKGGLPIRVRKRGE